MSAQAQALSPLTWNEVAAYLTDLDAKEPGRYFVRGEWHQKRSIAEEVRSGAHYRPIPGDAWLILGDRIYQTTEGNLAKWIASGAKGVPPHADRRLTVVDSAPMEDAKAPVENMGTMAPVKPTGFGWKESAAHPGLWVQFSREQMLMTFWFNKREQSYDARTGAPLVFLGGEPFPEHITAYVREKLDELLPPHKRAKKEGTALAGTQAAPVNTPPLQGSVSPIVSARAVSVNKEDPMNPIDQRMNEKARELRAKMDNLLSRQVEAEDKYRDADRAVEELKDRVYQAESAVKEREDEILAEVTTEVGPDGKPRFTNDTGRKAAVTTRKKSDEEYLALKQALEAIRHEQAAARMAADRAKSAYNGMNREYHLLDADMRLLTGQIAKMAASAAAAVPSPHHAA